VKVLILVKFNIYDMLNEVPIYWHSTFDHQFCQRILMFIINAMTIGL